MSSLQYIYVRNYIQNTIVKRVSLLHFPTCFSLIDYTSLLISDDHLAEDGNPLTVKGGEEVLACVGTKEGKLLMIKVSSTGSQRLAETKSGLSYGAITAVEIAAN